MTLAPQPGDTPWRYQGRGLDSRLIDRMTIGDVLQARREEDGSKPALTWCGGEPVPERWTYAQLCEDVTRLAGSLVRNYGVERGDRVVVVSSNCPEAYIVYLTLLSIGAVAVPVNNHESRRARDFVVSEVQPRLIIVGRSVAEAFSDASAPVAAAAALLSAARDDPAPPNVAARVQPDDLAVILFTSGTTSDPKGVCLSHYNLLVNAEGLRRVHRLDAHKNHLCILPLFHANAFGFSMVASVSAANHVVLCDGFPGAEIWSIARRERVNIISAVPEILRLLGAAPLRSPPPPDLKYVVSAAAPLSWEVARAFRERTGLPIHQGYGLSECTNFAATIRSDVSPASYDRLMSEWSVPSIGPPLFGTEMRIARPDGSAASEGEEGEVLIAGHNVMARYWQAPAATEAALRGGWLHTGDLGYHVVVDGKPHFFISGRLKEIIIRYGENISPRAVEAELRDLAQLGRFAVCGFRNDAAGEEIAVYVEAEPSEAVMAEVAAILRTCPLHYRPRVAIVGQEPVPATVTGKVQRSRLAARFAHLQSAVFGNKTRVVAPLPVAGLDTRIDHDQARSMHCASGSERTTS